MYKKMALKKDICNISRISTSRWYVYLPNSRVAITWKLLSAVKTRRQTHVCMFIVIFINKNDQMLRSSRTILSYAYYLFVFNYITVCYVMLKNATTFSFLQYQKFIAFPLLIYAVRCFCYQLRHAHFFLFVLR